MEPIAPQPGNSAEAAASSSAAATPPTLHFSHQLTLLELAVKKTRAGKPPFNAIEELVDALLPQYIALEAQITPVIARIAAEHGGWLHQLPLRFKERDSQLRKTRKMVDAESRERAPRGPAGWTWLQATTMYDMLRYTLVLPCDTYCDTIREVRGELNAMGYRSVLRKNYWREDPTYNGVNDVFVKQNEGGERLMEGGELLFELLFQTDESVGMNKRTWPVYQAFRMAQGAEIAALQQQLEEMAAAVARPPGIDQIETHMARPYLWAPLKYTDWHSERDTAEGGRSYEAMVAERDPALGFLDVAAAGSLVVDLQRWRHRSGREGETTGMP